MFDMRVKESFFWCIFLYVSFQFEMASGKVLEETYRKWLQYKEDCVKMIENEPPSQGMKKLHSRKGEHGKRGERKKNCQAMLFEIESKIICGFVVEEILTFPILSLAGLFCNRTFDRYACWPDTPAGSVVNISCPFYLPWYDKGKKTLLASLKSDGSNKLIICVHFN